MKVIKKILKYMGATALVYIFLCLTTPFNHFLRNRSIKHQINYLSSILDNGYDNRLQVRFPEGKLFSNAILALSTIEYCESNHISNERYAKIVDACIKRIQSERALRNFNSGMTPKYGMFYNAWSNYVYQSYENSPLFEFSSMQGKVRAASDTIELRLLASLQDSLRLLDSYAGSNWPADNCIAMLSLDNDDIQKAWLSTLLNATEHPSGLIHHSGSQKNRIRGSSSAMITFCLSELGYEGAEAYNEKFKEIFIDTYFGVQLVKENEDGSNKMDVDSGPVLFGYGASATIMNIKTQASLDKAGAKSSYAVMNLISFPVNLFNRKYHLFKKEPMLDLFLLWANVEINNFNQ